jgi:hypothetical protein
MEIWRKVIVSGSDAQVASLDINQTSDVEGDDALQVEDGQVSFPNLSTLDDPYIDEGTLTNQLGFVFAHNAGPADDSILIPWNYPAGDLNGDGEVTTADLLIFLGAFGTAPGFGDLANMDGGVSVTTSDLLLFLTSFGEDVTTDDDTRPEITWNDSTTYTFTNSSGVTKGWVNTDATSVSYGRVNVDSVTAFYNHVLDGGDDDSDFWALLPNGGTTTFEGPNNDVADYITQMPSEDSPTLAMFLYIYFQQFSGAEGDISNTGITYRGGHDIWNREALGPNLEDGYPG